MGCRPEAQAKGSPWGRRLVLGTPSRTKKGVSRYRSAGQKWTVGVTKKDG